MDGWMAVCAMFCAHDVMLLPLRLALMQEFMAKWNTDRDALMTRRTYPIKLLAHEVEVREL